MSPDEQLELFAQYDEEQRFTAALQLMRHIHDGVVDGGEEAVHADLLGAIDDLSLRPWHELDQPLVEDWLYAIECRLLTWLMGRLEVVSSGPAAAEAWSPHAGFSGQVRPRCGPEAEDLRLGHTYPYMMSTDRPIRSMTGMPSPLQIIDHH